MSKALLIFDNQHITRLGLITMTGRMGLFDPIITGESKAELINRLAEHPEAVVIIDYTKFELTAERLIVLAERFEAARWVLFCDILSEDFVRRVTTKHSNFSIVMKDAPLQEIEDTIRIAHDGGRYLCSKARSFTAMQNQAARRTGLTGTETEILKSLALGKSTKDIAAERFLSVYTVMTHRRNIFAKLNVNNVHEATRFAMRAGIVDSSDYFI